MSFKAQRVINICGIVSDAALIIGRFCAREDPTNSVEKMLKMKTLNALMLSAAFATWSLSFGISSACAQSQYENSTEFAKFALKLREGALLKLRPSPTRTTYYGTGTGYGSGSRPAAREPYLGNAAYSGVSGTRILMVGDSMTVGGFGEAMQDYLLKRFGQNNVAVFASCGSSPEQWLRSGPNFITNCGYREQTPRSSILYDFQNGKRPEPVQTPKLEDLISQIRPTTLIVQLGTNWMDGLDFDPAGDKSTYSNILDRFVAAVRGEPNTVRRIIWITPPDSSRYSNEVQLTVANLIKTAAQRNSFATIDSSSMTHYVPGRSGSDGVHYNTEEAKQWAYRVMRELDRMLR
jgi:hypothetical protein